LFISQSRTPGCAREFKCQDRVVIVGKVANSQFIRHTIDLVGKFYQTQFTYPDNHGYATVYGAAMKFLHDQNADGND
jgi:fumarylacetoacetate (FAA) hydrolase family protein